MLGHVINSQSVMMYPMRPVRARVVGSAAIVQGYKWLRYRDRYCLGIAYFSW
jgi:hypothetical protein